MGMLRSLFRKEERATTGFPPAETVAPPTPSAGWGSAPSGVCDVCNAPLSGVGGARVPGHEFTDLVRRGYNPVESGRMELARAFYGGTNQEVYETWKQMALQDTTDWGLCETCASDLRAFRDRA